MSNELANLPKSLQQVVVYFSDPDRAHKFAVALRWPDGIECPRCGSKEHSYISTRRFWFCKGCKKQFTVKVGSIFEDSPLGMDKWMLAVWLIVACKNGISSYEIASHLDITQKSAWHMMHRIRLAMQGKDGGKLDGEIEVDETFIGGKARNMHRHIREKRIRSRGPEGKAVVMAVLERHGEVRPKVVENTSQDELQGHVRKNVHLGAQVNTDAHPGYFGLDERYMHMTVDHAEAYVQGNVHTNGLENFWSLLKRGINGTYISVEPFHLFRYVDEQAFRFNNRKVSASDRFIEAMRNVSGKRLTWDRLTGKEADAQTQVN